MKKLLLLALLAMIMVGCETHAPKTVIANHVEIIQIDSCEYIIYYGRLSAHKGNCKFCLERNRKMVKEQIDSALIEMFD